MNVRAVLSSLVLVLVTILGVPAVAQTPTCDKLHGPERALAQVLLSTLRAYDCCDDTLAKCLQKKAVCGLVSRVAEDVCRRVAAGQGRSEIEQELKRRVSSAIGPKHVIDLGGYTSVGDASAPVVLVAYACPRCPLCARIVPALFASVTTGKLKGRARLYVKPFPIRTHEHSTEAALAWMAGRKLGRYWELLLAMYSDFDHFDPGKLGDYAATQGMDRRRFSAMLEDRGVREELTQSKKEGVRNSVDATPAIFIDGRRYLTTLELPNLEDFVEERLEKNAEHASASEPPPARD